MNVMKNKVGKLWPELEKLREFELEIRSSKAHWTVLHEEKKD